VGGSGRGIFRSNIATGPIVVAAHSKAWNGFYSSNTSIMGSNPTRSVDICARFSLFILSRVDRRLARAHPPFKVS
jgi:hypothetical protein